MAQGERGANGQFPPPSADRGNPQITADLRRWAGQLRAVLDQPGGGEAFIALLTYIELVSEARAGEPRDLAASLGPDAERRT